MWTMRSSPAGHVIVLLWLNKAVYLSKNWNSCKTSLRLCSIEKRISKIHHRNRISRNKYNKKSSVYNTKSHILWFFWKAIDEICIKHDVNHGQRERQNACLFFDISLFFVFFFKYCSFCRPSCKNIISRGKVCASTNNRHYKVALCNEIEIEIKVYICCFHYNMFFFLHNHNKIKILYFYFIENLEK